MNPHHVRSLPSALVALAAFLLFRAGPNPDAASEPLQFDVIVLDSTVTNPMEIAIAGDGRVFIAERGGALKVWDPTDDSTYTAGFFPASATLNDGFLGLTLDPDFDENGWAYLHYSPLEGGPRNRVSRVTIEGRRVRPGSEKVMLEWRTQRQECCHAGGSLAFGPDGNLFIATGDNTFPEEDLYAPIDERPGHVISDAQRTAGNTNDLRGSILRLRPTPEGSYTIPEGNLFPPGTPKTRPEIYVMGVRNAYRIAVDPATGWLIWGDVGPGAVVPRDDRGPAGYDEINIAREPGFFGWPYFNADNRPYRDVDFATGTVGDFFDPAAPVNDSPNNTGLRNLPPAQPPSIWYTKTDTSDFPVLGVGGATAIAGPRYQYDAQTVHRHGLPESLDGMLIIGDWMRNWLMQVDVEAEGRAVNIEPVVPDVRLRPMDIELGPDGRLYVIDWGPRYIGYNLEARIIRLDYHDGRYDADADSDARANAVADDDANADENADANADANADYDAGPDDDADAEEPQQSPIRQSPAPEVFVPKDGSIFDYDAPIAYQIATSSEDVEVRTSLLCDSHIHLLDTLEGSSGTFRVSRRPTLIGYTIKRDEALILEVRTGVGRENGITRGTGSVTRRIILQPRRKEAEHVSASRDVERMPLTPIRDSSYVQTALAARDGGFAAYAPINLSGIGAVNLRIKPVTGAAIELRLDSPEGTLLGRVNADTAAVLRHPAKSDLESPDGVERPSLNGWADLSIPIDDSGGTHTLFLVFRSTENAANKSEADLVLIDWLEFEQAAN